MRRWTEAEYLKDIAEYLKSQLDMINKRIFDSKPRA
jgi:hypothetical protein